MFLHSDTAMFQSVKDVTVADLLEGYVWAFVDMKDAEPRKAFAAHVEESTVVRISAFTNDELETRGKKMHKVRGLRMACITCAYASRNP